jgi:hypothetical protein
VASHHPLEIIGHLVEIRVEDMPVDRQREGRAAMSQAESVKVV